ncbi:serine hydrolase [Yeosuana aromativorans]|uniref:Serine hydrolase n=1 Tax=Yeosuana aromativorans TaxID=288019 RepID=A0A8J3BMU9_9FLAO|nr:serine hydrolase domain-containing protein [Yeosuana aromativorans]GGK33895.1 serine hydrolase [Yeosuana aromativorans]
MKKHITIGVLFLSTLIFGQTLPKIDSIIKQEMKSDKIAALAIAVIDSGKVVHLSANGFRDIKDKLPATINTPFHIASVSKTVTNLAVFKLVESGKIDLKMDINKYLPFEVKNPFYPNDIITVRDLLNHRSGIKDDSEIYEPFWNIPKGDSPFKLGNFLKDYLSEDGKQYKKDHYESDSNYKSFNYSNTGVALLGLIVEQVSGMDFEDFCQINIFKPMEMTNTSWFLKNLDSSLVAKTYVHHDAIGLVFKGHNGYPDYPGGQLRTSISDFAKLWAGYLNVENSNFMLTPITTKFITPSPRIAQEGFFTWFLTSINSHLYYFHNGGDTGASTVIAIDVYNKRGIIIFSNSEVRLNKLLSKIEKKI